MDGLLYQGTYLFVGSPKVGKEFYDGTARLPYQHWHTALELQSPQGNRCCILPLKMITARLQRSAPIRCSALTEQTTCILQQNSKTVNGGLDEQIKRFYAGTPRHWTYYHRYAQKRVRENQAGTDYSYGSDYQM